MVGVGGTNLPLTIQTFVKFHDFKEAYLHKFSTKVMATNLPILLIERHSFEWCRQIFLNLSMSKVEKNREKVYATAHCSLSNRLTPTHPDSLQIELIYLLYSTC